MTVQLGKVLGDLSTPESTNLVGSKLGAGLTYSGSGTAFIAGLSISDWGVIVGIIGVIFGLAIQFIFKWREDQRQERAWAELHPRKGKK